MEIKLTKLPELGTWDENVWRQTPEEEKRGDIDPSKMYLVSYEGIWLIGRFSMQWYGWNFDPNMGSMSIQIEFLKEIFEIEGLPQERSGSTAAFISDYLPKEDEDEDEYEDEE